MFTYLYLSRYTFLRVESAKYVDDRTVCDAGEVLEWIHERTGGQSTHIQYLQHVCIDYEVDHRSSF